MTPRDVHCFDPLHIVARDASHGELPDERGVREGMMDSKLKGCG